MGPKTKPTRNVPRRMMESLAFRRMLENGKENQVARTRDRVFLRRLLPFLFRSRGMKHFMRKVVVAKSSSKEYRIILGATRNIKNMKPQFPPIMLIPKEDLHEREDKVLPPLPPPHSFVALRLRGYVMETPSILPLLACNSIHIIGNNEIANQEPRR